MNATSTSSPAGILTEPALSSPRLLRRFRFRSAGWTVVAGMSMVLLVPNSCAEATAAALSPFAAAPSGGSTLLALVRVLGALALVFALFFGGLWLWRNWQRLLLRHGPVAKLAVLEAKSLGQRHSIYVIGYEQQRMLVAASPSGVSLLASLPPAEASLVPTPLVQSSPTATAPAPAFGALLLRAITQRG